ncbi:MAG TPA: hypothetical protein VFM14_14415 [Gemmatimonadales bacterium]|nr:hypothetical protein [Gemmatimonadales bacterium]
MTGLLRTAVLGAAAGVAGGLAMLAADQLEGRVGARKAESSWVRAVRDQARRRGHPLPGGRARTLAAAVNLAYAALLGVVYGIARSRLPRRPAARTALVTALGYAMHLPRRDEPGAPAELSPVFGLATAAAFDALAGR